MLHGFNRDQPFFANCSRGEGRSFQFFRAPPAEPEARDRRPEVRRIEDPKPCWPSSPNGANGMRDRSTQRYAVASIEGSKPDWRRDEGRSQSARAANKSQNGNKVKQLRPGPTGHKFRGAASGAPRKNRTWETRRLARSIRDVAFASRRESVAEARPRCGSGDRLTWTQPSARQAQLFGQTTWRICSLKIAAALPK
jgi:hypothetical protein